MGGTIARKRKESEVGAWATGPTDPSPTLRPLSESLQPVNASSLACAAISSQAGKASAQQQNRRWLGRLLGLHARRSQQTLTAIQSIAHRAGIGMALRLLQEVIGRLSRGAIVVVAEAVLVVAIVAVAKVVLVFAIVPVEEQVPDRQLQPGGMHVVQRLLAVMIEQPGNATALVTEMAVGTAIDLVL